MCKAVLWFIDISSSNDQIHNESVNLWVGQVLMKRSQTQTAEE